jgi:hypothetical protein
LSPFIPTRSEKLWSRSDELFAAKSAELRVTHKLAMVDAIIYDSGTSTLPICRELCCYE